MYKQIAELCQISPEDLKKFLEDHSVQTEYEKGLLTSSEITSLLNQKSHRKINEIDFMKAASNIFSLRPEMLDLLKQLKVIGYQLILLSNTNQCHFDFINKKYNFFHLFDHLILSYQVGSIKPEEKIFKYTLSKIVGLPKECFYIDDIPEYVEAGKQFGIDGHIYTSFSFLKKDLAQRQILS